MPVILNVEGNVFQHWGGNPITCGIRLGEGEERGGEGGVRPGLRQVGGRWRGVRPGLRQVGGSQGAVGVEDKGVAEGGYQGEGRSGLPEFMSLSPPGGRG